MKKVIIIIAVNSLLLLVLSSVVAAGTAQSEKEVVDPVAVRVVDYSFPDEYNYLPSSGEEHDIGLDRTKANPNAFGWKAGDTYYDQQHNFSMGRQVGVGQSASCQWTVHFAWMFLPSPVLEDREIFYNGWDGAGGAEVGYYEGMQNPDEYAGYASLAVTDDNRFVIACHNDYGTGYRIQTYWQFICNVPFHSANVRVPDSLNDCGNTHLFDPKEAAVIWPKVAVQNPPDGDRVLHLIGSAYGGGSGAANFSYFQYVGPESGGGTWTFGCAIDTIFNGESYDITASEDGTVAISWLALIPEDPGCDTCSRNSSTGNPERDRWDNDFYYQINRNYGRGWLGYPYDGYSNWWENRVNLTKNISGDDGFRPFSDIISLISSDGIYHAAWVAMEWDDDNIGTYRSRIYHWSENLGFEYGGYGSGNIRTVSAAQWDPENCNPGSFNQNQAKLSLTQCGPPGDERLYVTWVELNSPLTTGNENHDDCAARAFEGDYIGAANGDLFISVSEDGGLTWDAARALTDTYGGPTGTMGACDPAGVGPCPSEHWMSAASHGTDYAVAGPSEGNVVNLDPGYSGNNYFDMAYIDDPDPGAAIRGYGSWYSADYLWIRVPCVDPVLMPGFAMSSSSFKYPEYVKHCNYRFIDVEVENTGNTGLTYSTSIYEDPGVYYNWLNIQNFDGDIPSGENNVETGQIILNYGGYICDPGTIVRVTGRVSFHTNEPATHEFEIELVVADTVILPVWDSLYTSCIALTVNNLGGAGNNGLGLVNMDFGNYWEEWEPERADVYLYEASPVLGWVNGLDTTVNYSMYNSSIADTTSLIPLGGNWSSSESWADIIHTSTIVSHDSSIALEVTWYAPLDPAYRCSFVVKKTRVYSLYDHAHDDIFVGDVVDWDVPGDSTVWHNYSGILSSPAEGIYLRGLEIPGWNDSLENANGGWDADQRYGAIVWLEGYRYSNDTMPVEIFDFPYGYYTSYNMMDLYSGKKGVDGRFLAENHSYSGTFISDSIGDLHAGITYVHSYDLQPSDTLEFFVAYATNLNDWYPKNSNRYSIDDIAQDAENFFVEYLKPPFQEYVCGDANDDGWANITDLTFLFDYVYRGGPAPPIHDAGDIDGHLMINANDVLTWWRVLIYGYPLFCPELGPSIPSMGVENDSLYVHSFESSFPYADILAPGQSTYNVRIHLSTDVALISGCFPMAIRVGTEIPDIVDVNVPNPEMFICQVDINRGVIDIDIFPTYIEGLDSGTYEIATVSIEVPPMVETWRPIYLYWDSFPPDQYGQATHQPWAAGPDFPPQEFWSPLLYRIPCIGIRGNIDGSEHEGTDISDVTFLVDYMFNNGWPPKVFEEADVNGTATLDITDLTDLVDYMWGTPSIPLEPCPAE